jgi:hypothetical protein
MNALDERPVDCPYCGAVFTTLIDTSAGECDYIEDCAVCCQPIEFQLSFAADGALQLLARRGDDNLF